MPGATMHENRGSKAGEVLWAVADDELETLPRNQVCRAVEQAFSRKPVKRKVRGGCKCVLQGLRAYNELWAKSLPIGGGKISIREAKQKCSTL
jgi:hypothetical protein